MQETFPESLVAKGDVSRVNAGRADFLEYLWQKETFLESAVAEDSLPVSFVAERNASWLTDGRVAYPLNHCWLRETPF